MIQESWEYLTDDEQIENHYVDCLVRERAWIEKRQMVIYMQEAWNLPEPHSDIGKEWNALNARLDFINKQLHPLLEQELWTTDEVSAALVEEELVKARERLDSACGELAQARASLDANPLSSTLSAMESYWVGVVGDREVEVFRLENLLIDNPASGWLPF